jgi:hypothetical protein
MQKNKQKIKNLYGEIWKSVVGYEDCYEVSNLGRVKGISRKATSINGRTYNLSEKLRILVDAGQGYLVVHLSKNGISRQCRVNILVAQAFHPNSNNLPQVLHLNDIKDDNRAINLKWGTAQDNTIHRYEVFGYKAPKLEKSRKSKKIIAYLPNGEEEMIIGIKTAAQKYGLARSSILRVLKEVYESHKGYKFKYA